jgi:ArsR family transcriptional regulator
MENRINYTQQAALLKALSHPLRLQLLHTLLQGGCRNVTCLERCTGMSQSCVSQHLQRLREAGLVTSERSGNEIYYQAASPAAARLVAAMFNEEVSDYVL